MVVKIIITLLSIVFVILTPLVIFGYSAKPVFYEPDIMQDILNQNGFFNALSASTGSDIISQSQSQAVSAILATHVPSMLEYLRGDSDKIEIIIKANELQSSTLTAIRKTLNTKISEKPVCSENEEPQLVSMMEFTCSPTSAQGKEIAVNKAMSQISPFLGLDQAEDIDISDQLTGELSALEDARNMLKTAFGMLMILLIIIILIIIGIFALRKNDIKLAFKTTGIIFLWSGISTAVISLALPAILSNIVPPTAGGNVLVSVIDDVITIITSNAQSYVFALVILGIFFIGLYYYVKSKQTLKKPIIK
ncbi:hypothetical protein CL614_00885 [archaeon]|nr:hypothetical protein [archaeon]|tara:strand:+ start:3568 stop:4488 length:921 start_codon:yes stop_codon:yes gene_type:complete